MVIRPANGLPVAERDIADETGIRCRSEREQPRIDQPT
jgi:hypothetical protein